MQTNEKSPQTISLTNKSSDAIAKPTISVGHIFVNFSSDNPFPIQKEKHVGKIVSVETPDNRVTATVFFGALFK